MTRTNIICALLIVTALVCAQSASAHIIGKNYMPGDIIMIDGIESLVFHVDDTGLHGKAMNICWPDVPGDLQKSLKKAKSRYEKKIKKGEMTEEQMNNNLSIIENAFRIPEPKRNKMAKIEHFDPQDWYKAAPEGWRLPDLTDAEDFCTFYCGGMGKDFKTSFKKFIDLSKSLVQQNDLFEQYRLMVYATKGFICTDGENIKFLARQMSKGLSMDCWFELSDDSTGYEMAFGVKDF